MHLYMRRLGRFAMMRSMRFVIFLGWALSIVHGVQLVMKACG
jgi:hypothetical protein